MKNYSTTRGWRGIPSNRQRVERGRIRKHFPAHQMNPPSECNRQKVTIALCDTDTIGCMHVFGNRHKCSDEICNRSPKNIDPLNLHTKFTICYCQRRSSSHRPARHRQTLIITQALWVIKLNSGPFFLFLCLASKITTGRLPTSSIIMVIMMKVIFTFSAW